MRHILVACLALAAFISGCSDENVSDSRGCPEEYGEDYEQRYEQYQQEYRNATGEDLVDTDGDCVPDDVETMLETDPADRDSRPAVEDVPDANVTAPQPESYMTEGTVAASGGVPGGASFQVGGTTLEIPVKEGATLLFAEIQWTDPVVDLDMHVQTPASAGSTVWEHSNEGGNPGMPDSPHTITVSSPEAGGWVSGVFAKGGGANTSYTLAATVFYGPTEVPEGFTALAA